jgi:hypothetical protein
MQALVETAGISASPKQPNVILSFTYIVRNPQTQIFFFFYLSAYFVTHHLPLSERFQHRLLGDASGAK